MCIVTVRKTFVHAVTIDDVEDDDLESPLARRSRASSDGATMRMSRALASSMDETPATTEAACGTPSVATCAGQRAAELEEALEAGGDSAVAAMAAIQAEMLSLSMDESGCCVVERAMELADPGELRDLARALRSSVAAAARSPHAQRVLEKAIFHLGTSDAAFIAEELAPQARAMAQSGTGCNVLISLMEFSPEDDRTVDLVDRILEDDLLGLLGHKFGHRVAVSMLSNCPCRQRARVVTALLSDMQRFARHRFASRVLEAAVLHGSQAERGQLARALMEQPGSVAALACHAFGFHVVRAVVEVPGEGYRAMQYLAKGQRRVRKDRYGMELLRHVGLEAAPIAGDGDGAVIEAGLMGGA